MPIHAPIYGSQFNPPAKLYKRFTNDISIAVKGDIITVQNNRYAYVDLFPWVEAAEEQEDEYQPINGLIVPKSHMTIKYNGLYKPDPKDIREPRVDDVLIIDGEIWMIESPIQRIRHRSLRNMATVILPLRRVL